MERVMVMGGIRIRSTDIPRHSALIEDDFEASLL
jgi:hypothetical protein